MCLTSKWLIRKLKFNNISFYNIDKNILSWNKNNKINNICGDLFFLPFRGKTFDVVYNLGVMEHFSNFEEGILEMLRVSKKYVIFAIPTVLFAYKEFFKLRKDEKINIPYYYHSQVGKIYILDSKVINSRIGPSLSYINIKYKYDIFRLFRIVIIEKLI